MTVIQKLLNISSPPKGRAVHEFEPSGQDTSRKISPILRISIPCSLLIIEPELNLVYLDERTLDNGRISYGYHSTYCPFFTIFGFASSLIQARWSCYVWPRWPLPGCDLGSMFAVPPRDTVYFTPNDKFYTVNFMDASYNFTRDLDVEQWNMVVKGAVQKPPRDEVA